MRTSRYFQTEIDDGILIISFLEQKLLDVPTIAEMGDWLQQLVEDPEAERVLLDCSEISFMSSMFLMRLNTFRRKMEAAKRPLAVTGLIPDIREVFRITRLEKDYALFDTKEEGLAHLRHNKTS